MIQKPLVTLIALTTLLLPTTGIALNTLPTPDDTRVVPDEVLAEQRGGFFGRDGMQVAIGLEQATQINGEVVHRSVMRELAPLERGNLPRAALEQVLIYNSSEGPSIRQMGDTAVGWVTAIQNDLDGQVIQHHTIMHLQLDNLPMPRSDLGRNLERALIESGRSW